MLSLFYAWPLPGPVVLLPYAPWELWLLRTKVVEVRNGIRLLAHQAMVDS